MNIDRDKIRARLDQAIQGMPWSLVATDPNVLSEILVESFLVILDELGSQANKALVIPLPDHPGDTNE